MGDVEPAELARTAPDDHYDVVSLLQRRMQRPEGLAHQSLAAVALDRLSDLFAGNDGVAVGNGVLGVRKNADNKRAQGKCLASGPGVSNFPIFAETKGAIHLGR